MDSDILKKIKKFLSANEFEKFDKGIKALVKESTEKNILLVKKQFEAKSKEILAEQKEELMDASLELVEESVKEQVTEKVAKEKNTQIKLVKQINKLKDELKNTKLSLNSDITELTETNKRLNNKLSKATNKTSSETINESVIVKDSSSEVLGVIEESYQTTMSDLQNNLSNESVGNDLVSQIANMIGKH